MKNLIKPKPLGKLIVVIFLFLALTAVRTYAQAPNISYASPQVYVVGTTITSLVPSNTGGAVTSGGYTIDKTLPIGLVLDQNSGVISGTPYISGPAKNYIVTASNGSGSSQATINIRVVMPAKPHISLGGPVVLSTGNAITPIVPGNTGGNVAIQTSTTLFVNSHFLAYPAVDTSGNVYAYDDGTSEVVKIPFGGGNPVTIGSGVSANALAVDNAGNVYIADVKDAAVKEIPTGGGGIITLGPRITTPIGIAVDTSGRIYVSKSDNHKVLRMPAGGGAFVYIGSGFVANDGIAVDAQNNVYVADGGDHLIKKIPAAGGSIDTLAQNGYASVGVDAENNVYFIPQQLSSLSVIEIPFYGGNPFVLNAQPISTIMAVDKHGNIYTTVNHEIGIINAGDYAINPVLPQGLSFDTHSGTISGTPTVANPATDYKITGKNASGSSSATINITVASTDAHLSNLSLSQGTLSPGFSFNLFNYTATVDSASIRVTPTRANAGATIKVNGTAVASGTASAPIHLSAGANTINVVVTAQDGTTTLTYTITINISSNANLLHLVPSKGVLSPAFAQATTSYTTNVANAVSSFTITPTVADNTATVKVKGVVTVSGTASAAIPLAVGPNVVNTQVIAQDGTTKKTYTITVTRAPSSNANLSGLHLSGGIVYSPAFATATNNYTASVANSKTSTTVKPISSVPTSTITVNGNAVASGTFSGAIPLAVGDNPISIVVTAQDGTTTNTYTVTVTRQTGPVANPPYAATALGRNADNQRAIQGDVVVHNALSPNGDGENDVLTIDGISKYPDNKLSIMSRSGALVFEAKGYDNHSRFFDGHSSKTGKMQQSGTYFYSLEYKVAGVTKKKTGYIVLKW